MAKKTGSAPQKVLIAVTFGDGVNEDGGKCVEASMEVEYHPAMPMLDPHKRNYGVKDLQAAAAGLPSIVERAIEAKGYKIKHPGKDNKNL